VRIIGNRYTAGCVIDVIDVIDVREHASSGGSGSD
jgi:hypothetical protein